MSTASYHGGPEFARGYAAAEAMQAWLGQGGQWIIAEGEGARPVTAHELAGIRAFYAEYAPGLRIAGCTYCGGSGFTAEAGEYGEPSELFPCGICNVVTTELEF